MCNEINISLILRIASILASVVILAFASKNYYEALKSHNKDILKKAQISFNKKMAIVILIMLIPTLVLIISKKSFKPEMYDCYFGKPKEILNEDKKDNINNQIEKNNENEYTKMEEDV